MTDVFDPYFRGLSKKEQQLMEVLIYDIVERGHQIEIDSFESFIRVLERVPDVYKQIISNFNFEFGSYDDITDEAMKNIHKEPSKDVNKQLALFRSFITRIK